MLKPSEYAHWVIYKFYSPSGGVYIGCTSNIELRKAHHRLVNKFPVNIEIIEEFFNTRSYAEGKEMFWIRSYVSNKCKYPERNGLNKTDGGVGARGFKHTEVSKQRLSISIKRGKGVITRPSRPNSKIVVQYNLDGKRIKEFGSIGEANEAMGLSKTSGSIAKVCRGDIGRKTCMGYVFKYKAA